MNIPALIDIIRKNSLADIQREIRSHVLSINQTINQLQLFLLNEKKECLQCAEKFLQAHSLFSQNQSLPQCYEKAAEWFLTQQDTEKRASYWSMISWKYFLIESFGEDFQPHPIMPLAITYYGIPQKFAGFILWLLESDVCPNDIIASGIIHAYFEFSVIDMQQIVETYDLLSIEANADVLCSYLQNSACGMQAFINRVLEDSSDLQSFNVMGKTFRHKNPVRLNKDRKWNNDVILNNQMKYHAVALYEIFQWEFIKRLNFNDQISRDIFEVLLSKKQIELIEKIPQRSLMGELNLMLVKSLLKTISRSSLYQETAAVLALIDIHPFYVTIVCFYPNILLTISPEKMHEFVKLFLSKIPPNSICSIPLLCDLYEFISENIFYATSAGLLKNYLFNQLLEHDNVMQDDIMDRILAMDEFDELCREQLEKFENNIFESINKCCLNQLSYDMVLTQWGGYLRHINIFVDIFPALKKTSRYPFSVYALKAAMIEEKWKWCLQHNYEFNLQQMIQMVCVVNEDDKDINERKMDEIKRTPYESLFYTKIEALLDCIFQEIDQKDIESHLVHSHLNDNDNIIQRAILTQNSALLKIISNKIPFTEENVIFYFQNSWLKKDLAGIEIILHTLTMSHSVIDDVLRSCYLHAVNTDFMDTEDEVSMTSFDCQVVSLFCLLPFDDHKSPSHKMYGIVMSHAINHKHFLAIKNLSQHAHCITAANIAPALYFAYDISDSKLFETFVRQVHIKKEIINSKLKELFFYAVGFDDQMGLYSILGPHLNNNVISTDDIQTATNIAVDKKHWRILWLLCGLTNQLTTTCMLFPKNNMKLYFTAIRRLNGKLHTVSCMNTLLMVRNAAGETCLHLLAKDNNIELITTYLLLLEVNLSKEELSIFLHKKNAQNEIAMASGSTESDAINKKLLLIREQYVLTPSPTEMSEQRKRRRSPDFFSDSDEEYMQLFATPEGVIYTQP